MRRSVSILAVLGIHLALLGAVTVQGQTKPRARDIGVPFEGSPGPLNAITDVASVAVGHVTLIEGEGPLQVGVGPIRTGVTGDPASSTDELTRVRWLVLVERERRNDGHDVGGGIRLPRRSGPDNEYT